jgi:hypothetical protein
MRVRQGQTSLTVAAPGAGKSQLWANLAHRLRVPTLYWSADTDQLDATARTLAMWLGLEVTDVEAKLTSEAWRADLFERLGHRAEHVDWCFDSQITPKGVGERLNAFAEVHGQYPKLVVLDNLSNAITDPTNEYAEVKQVMGGVQVLARQTMSHIAVLHHAKGTFDGGETPIPQSGGIQNPFKLPELGLTLFRRDNSMGVCIVKNRGGRSDPAARNPIFLPIDFSRATVGGFQ